MTDDEITGVAVNGDASRVEVVNGSLAAADKAAVEVLNSDVFATTMAKAIVPFVKTLIEEASEEVLLEVARKQAPLTSRLLALETRPHVCYRGVWDLKTTYDAGDMVTRHGVLWFATKANVEEAPGGGATSWRLMNKSQR